MSISIIEDKPKLVLGAEKWQAAPFRFLDNLQVFNDVAPSWQDIILSGNTALTLTNAKANGLNYLKLFGGIVQGNLPSGYTQVEYLEIETSGIYFSTNINATVDTDIGIIASGVTSESAQLLVAQCVSGSDYFRIAKASASRKIIGTLGSSTVTDTNTDGANKFTARMNKSGFYVNGSLVGTFSNIPSSLTGVGKIDIFRGVYSSSTYYAYPGTRLYSAWVDNNIFFTCRRDSDNQLGILNTKTGEFILPLGTGTLIAGPDVITPTPDYPMYIISNNGAIKATQNLIDLNVATNGYYYDPQGIYSASSTSRLTGYIPVKAGQSVTVYFKSLSTTGNLNVRINIFNSNKVWQSQEVLQLTPEAEGVKIVTPSSDGYIRISANYVSSACVDWNTAKVVYGEYTATTIDSAIGKIYIDGIVEMVEVDTTNDTAMAEMLLKVGDYRDVQNIINGHITRNVGIKVLDGTENWQLATSTNLVQFYTTSTQGIIANNISIYSTIVPYGCTVSTRTQYDFGCYSGGTGNLCFQMKGSTTLTTVNAWVTYLTSQFNAGTPVIVVYPLATPTTETVEPQHLGIQAGTNVIEITQASIDNLELEVSYKATT